MTDFNPAEWIVDTQIDQDGRVLLRLTNTGLNHLHETSLRFPPELTARVAEALRQAYPFEVREGDPEPDRSTRWDTGEEFATDEADSSLHWDAELDGGGWTWGACYVALPWTHYEVQKLLPLTRI